MTLSSPTNRTLADVVLGPVSVQADILLTIAGSLVIAALAQIAIPIGPVPVTGQTLGVLLIAAALGPVRGTRAVILYLAEGAMGFPVFAGGRAGLVVLTGPTGGYLIGFVAAAVVVGWLCRIGWDRRPVTALGSMVIGSATIYLFGVLWLSQFIGWPHVFQVGVFPFLIGDALKAGVATAALPFAWTLARRR